MSSLSPSDSGGWQGGDGVVKKPWGWENRFAITEKYLGKVIHVNAGEMLSLQYHRQKDETVLVVKGVMDLLLEDDRGQLQTHRLTPGMSRRIVPGRKHRMTGVEECEFFEVSTPEIDDVVRLEDKYGRQGTSTA
ncbi:MAG TPA: cupin domain-containing protein [Candidatus Dormibacteraeota bacterium]|nr:cupin domain-containing protein [Candidatus Dormibacteraeota bacterium]